MPEKAKRVPRMKTNSWMFTCLDGPKTAPLRSEHIVEADTEEGAWEKMRGDPYINSNMYETITVHHFVPACGALLGGVIWDQDEIRSNMEKYAKG